jgi:hypothetical protein
MMKPRYNPHRAAPEAYAAQLALSNDVRTCAIGVINTWNRIAISARSVAGVAASEAEAAE